MTNMGEHAKELYRTVTRVRSECRRRRIIFVAHSLGGILVKGAILESSRCWNPQSQLDLGQSCQAIIFFGTPHLGPNATEYGDKVAGFVDVLRRRVSRNVLRGLKPDGEVVASINMDFYDLLNRSTPTEQKIQILSFQESIGVAFGGWFDRQVSLQ